MQALKETTRSTGLESLNIYKSYMDSKYLSIKHSSYFQVYEELLAKYINKEITFVEIGVLNGGSLFMWRNFFGPEARIIGVDLNPAAKKWETDGFEIYIGSQSDENFWDTFFTHVGDVDVVLDDGGHTNEQQIVTTHKSISHIKNGGMLIVEDVHSSYMVAFANPSKYSFINYAKYIIDCVNSRFPEVKHLKNDFRNMVYSVTFFESIVCFNIDRNKCFVSVETSNDGIPMQAMDYRNERSANLKNIESKFNFFRQITPIKLAGKALLIAISRFKSKKYFL
jgi:hypothetical protein